MAEMRRHDVSLSGPEIVPIVRIGIPDKEHVSGRGHLPVLVCILQESLDCLWVGQSIIEFIVNVFDANGLDTEPLTFP